MPLSLHERIFGPPQSTWLDRLRAQWRPEPNLGTRGLGLISRTIQNNPRKVLALAALASTGEKAFTSSQQNYANQLRQAYDAGARTVTASDTSDLDEFLEGKAKTASVLGGFARAGQGLIDLFAPKPSFLGMMGGKATDALAAGLGTAAVGGLAKHLGKSWKSLNTNIRDNPRREALLKLLFSKDPILSDAIHRDAGLEARLLEAYGTMVKFAPTLSLDINAVRSFLRESVLAGGGVNYATIKTLIDTERAATGKEDRR